MISPPPGRPMDASMDLLNQIARNPYDPDYAVVAARGGGPGGRRWMLGLVAALAGAMFAVAAVQTTRQAPALAGRTQRAHLPRLDRAERAGSVAAASGRAGR